MQRLRTEHDVDVGRARDDGLAFLARHAAAHADLHALGLQVLHAAEVGEHLLLRFLAHRAGVEQDEVGLVHVLRGLVALRGVEHVGHLVRVVLVHLAAEGLDEYFFHGELSVPFAKRKGCEARVAPADFCLLAARPRYCVFSVSFEVNGQMFRNGLFSDSRLAMASSGVRIQTSRSSPAASRV
ncbi:hypothetical protein D3C72_1503340 [compost metagenome]